MGLGLKFDDDFVFTVPKFKNFDKMTNHNRFITQVNNAIKDDIECRIENELLHVPDTVVKG